MRPMNTEIANGFRSALEAAFGETPSHAKRQSAQLAKQRSEIGGEQYAYQTVFGGAHDQDAFSEVG
jgi:hypothetical protein